MYQVNTLFNVPLKFEHDGWKTSPFLKPGTFWGANLAYQTRGVYLTKARFAEGKK